MFAEYNNPLDFKPHECAPAMASKNVEDQNIRALLHEHMHSTF
jgi:hypothetical protein